MDNMQYFDSRDVLEMLKRVIRVKDDLDWLVKIMVEEDPTFAKDVTAALVNISCVKSLLLKGNELIHNEQEGWLALVNGNVKGQLNPMFWNEEALEERLVGHPTQEYTDGVKSRLLAESQEAKILEQANRIEALEDELEQLRK